jgi:hypothetical protein
MLSEAALNIGFVELGRLALLRFPSSSLHPLFH